MKKKTKISLIIAGTLLAVILIILALTGIAFSKVEVTYEPSDDIVQPVKFGNANIYFIETETGYILVDAGVAGAEEKLNEVFTLAKIDPKSIQLIIVTHGHWDHIGLLAYVKEISGAKLLVHKSIQENIKNGEFEEAIARDSWSNFINFMASLLPAEIKGVEPDILVDDTFSLNEYGIRGKIIHTPGHSQSSMSIILDSGEALIGDMVRPDKDGNIYLGMWYEDKEVLINSLEKVAEQNPKIIYLSHGKTIDNTVLKKTITELR